MEIIKKIQTRRGASLSIKGEAEKIIGNSPSSTTFAFKPDDFFGTVPRLLKKEGEDVQAGEPIFFSKKVPQIKFVSPVSGVIETIQRGARRKIEKIIIRANASSNTISHDCKNWEKLNREDLKSLLLESGNWPFIHQRPYGTIANPEDTPKAIFVSTHLTSPLSPDNDFFSQ